MTVEMQVKPNRLAKAVMVKVNDGVAPPRDFGSPLTPQPFATRLEADGYQVLTYSPKEAKPVTQILAAEPPP